MADNSNIWSICMSGLLSFLLAFCCDSFILVCFMNFYQKLIVVGILSLEILWGSDWSWIDLEKRFVAYSRPDARSSSWWALTGDDSSCTSPFPQCHDWARHGWAGWRLGCIPLYLFHLSPSPPAPLATIPLVCVSESVFVFCFFICFVLFFRSRI